MTQLISIKYNYKTYIIIKPTYERIRLPQIVSKIQKLMMISFFFGLSLGLELCRSRSRSQSRDRFGFSEKVYGLGKVGLDYIPVN